MERRRFVQLCVGAAGAGAAVAGAGGFTRSLVIGRPPLGPPVRYFGAHRTAGPAPRGVPLVPLALNADGAFEGKPFVETGVDENGNSVGVNVLEWYRYCDKEGAPGLDANADVDNLLRYDLPEAAVATVRPWFADRTGRTLRPDDFPGDEFGATFRWRSEGVAPQDVLSGVIVRYPRDAIRHRRRVTGGAGTALTEDEFDLVRRHFLVERGDSVFAAAFASCTHFCCVHGYKLVDGARDRGAWDKLYCACHHSVYDLRTPTAYVYYPTRRNGEA